MGFWDTLKGSDGKWGWEDLAAGAFAPVTGGASIHINNRKGGLGGLWDDLTGNDDIAQAQSDLAAGTAADQAYSFPNVEGVLGSNTVTRDPVTGAVTLRQSLSPEQQALVDSLRGQVGTSPGAVSDAVYDQYTSRLDPMWSQREDSARTRLINQGLTEGDAAYDRAMTTLGQERTDAYGAAQRAATLAGSQEQDRLIRAIMLASNPGLASYWGDSNATEAAIAQGNLAANKTSPLDLGLGILDAFIPG